MSEIELKYGRGGQRFTVPDRNLLAIVRPRPIHGTSDELAELRAALDSPIGSPCLRDLVRPGDKVAIVASDITRPSPSSKIIPALLDELSRAGASDEDVTVVFALGIHRGHTDAERRALVGESVWNRVRCIDFDPQDCVRVGTTRFGTPVEVFSEVVRADIRICTGNVEHHYFAGYTGGAKAILPGVSSRDSVLANHRMMLSPGATAARAEGNPVREDIEDAAEIFGVDFILNVVLGAKREIVRAFAGDCKLAHETARKAVDSLFCVTIKEKADIVVTSGGGYPKDLDLYQAQKALENARLAVKPGGVIILAAECPEGFGERTFEDWMRGAVSPDDLIERIGKGFVLGGHKAAAIAAAAKEASLCLVSSLDRSAAGNVLPWRSSSIDQALRESFARLGPGATVLVMPEAGMTLPVGKH